MLTGTLHKLFQVPVYSCHVERYNEIDAVVTDKVLDSLVVQTPQGWNCDVETSFDQRQKDVSWMRTFYSIIQPKLEDYISKSFGCDNTVVQMNVPWVNRYNKGQFQERHNHLGYSFEMFSYCYFHRLPAEAGCAEFKFKSSCEVLEHQLPAVLKSQKEFKPDVQQYDIIVFPSWVEHLVTPHNLDNPRVTISGNFSVNIKK